MNAPWGFDDFSVEATGIEIGGDVRIDRIIIKAKGLGNTKRMAPSKPENPRLYSLSIVSSLLSILQSIVVLFAADPNTTQIMMGIAFLLAILLH